ncbi:DUF6171 family protein [Anaeromicropila herbilytica]|nr:DUF6171 family protein [Anaeromicropila herbilytica]
MEQRFCKKCLLKDISRDEYFKNVYEYIENLDEDIKAEDMLYKERLTICKQCDNLANGMCRICGCFVEMRAAIKKNYCPNNEKKW